MPTSIVQVIKEAMDKKFGGPWHVVAGNCFSFEVTHEVRLQVTAT